MGRELDQSTGTRNKDADRSARETPTFCARHRQKNKVCLSMFFLLFSVLLFFRPLSGISFLDLDSNNPFPEHTNSYRVSISI